MPPNPKKNAVMKIFLQANIPLLTSKKQLISVFNVCDKGKEPITSLIPEKRITKAQMLMRAFEAFATESTKASDKL